MQWKNRWRGVVVAAGIGLSGVAGAHELVCDKDILVDLNGVPAVMEAPEDPNANKIAVPVWSVSEYPATITYRVRIDNASATGKSQVLAAYDPLVEGSGFAYTPMPAFWIEKGGYFEKTLTIEVRDYLACLELAKKDEREDAYIDNVFHATWDKGEALCAARLKCLEPEDPQPPVDAGVPEDPGHEGPEID